MNTLPQCSLQCYALVELMGHQRIAGLIGEQVIAGTPMLRVDVPAQDGSIRYTRYYSSAAIYAVNPIERDLAIRLAQTMDTEPVKAYELPRLVVASDGGASEPEDEEPDLDDDGNEIF